MNATLSLSLSATDWLAFFMHYLSLSLLAVGGAIATVPDMHRFLVENNHWLTDAQFNASIAIAQAAPGPNVLFIALLGWNVGLNAGGALTGLLGVFLSMAGILIPSTLLTYNAAQWGSARRARFQAGHGAHRGGADHVNQLDPCQRQRHFAGSLAFVAAVAGERHDLLAHAAAYFVAAGRRRRPGLVRLGLSRPCASAPLTQRFVEAHAAGH